MDAHFHYIFNSYMTCSLGHRRRRFVTCDQKKDYKYSQVLCLGDIQFNKCNGLSKKNGSAMGTYSAFPFSLLFIKGGSKLEHI